MKPTTRHLLLLVLILAAFGSTSGSASAATVERNSVTGELTYTAEPGELNHVRLSASGGAFEFLEQGVALTAGDGCTVVPVGSWYSANCSGAVSAISFELGDGSDYFRIGSSSDSLPLVRVQGGEGNDDLGAFAPTVGNVELSGGAGADRLATWNTGTSVLNGGSGEDTMQSVSTDGVTMQAQDGERDYVSCGGVAGDLTVDAIDEVDGCQVPDTNLTLTSTPTRSSRVYTLGTPTPMDATYECRVDEGPWEACTSPWTVSGLSAGAHAVEARAVNTAGIPDPSPASAVIDVDMTPPNTAVTSRTSPALGHPTGLTNAATQSFSFAADSGGVPSAAPTTFECQLDGSSWQTCDSPTSFSGLADGSHTFRVRAIGDGDTANPTSPDPTPAESTWTVDRTSPTVGIAGPGAATPVQPGAVRFDVSSNESGVTFTCSFDAEPAYGCTSTAPVHRSGLTDGPHSLQVTAEDAAGNSTATQRSFVVDGTAPTVDINSGPDGEHTSTSAEFSFAANETGVSYECRLGTSGPWETCTSPAEFEDLARGDAYRFQARATDAAGNVGEPATRDFSVVDASAPETYIHSAQASGNTLHLHLGSNQDPVTYEVRLADGPWRPTGTNDTASIPNVSAGTHLVEARATNRFGAVDATPARRMVLVVQDTTDPGQNDDDGRQQNNNDGGDQDDDNTDDGNEGGKHNDPLRRERLECGRLLVALVDAQLAGKSVRLQGVVAEEVSKAKLPITIYDRRKRLATVKPKGDGTWSARVKAPRGKKARASARYLAKVKVGRRMATSREPRQLAVYVTSSAKRATKGTAHTITMRGRIARGYVARSAAARRVNVYRLTCGRYRRVATTTANSTGSWKVSFASPAGKALYRAQARVLASPQHRKLTAAKQQKKMLRRYARAVGA